MFSNFQNMFSKFTKASSFSSCPFSGIPLAQEPQNISSNFDKIGMLNYVKVLEMDAFQDYQK